MMATGPVNMTIKVSADTRPLLIAQRDLLLTLANSYSTAAAVVEAELDALDAEAGAGTTDDGPADDAWIARAVHPQPQPQPYYDGGRLTDGGGVS